jgi:hypothetical protein
MTLLIVDLLAGSSSQIRAEVVLKEGEDDQISQP